MLTRLTESETARYDHWAYALATRGETASYPSYRDGIKTWEDFIRPDDSPDAEALLFRHEGRVYGWIAWYAIPAERYAATSAFLVETYADDAVREFVAHVRAICPGFTLDIGMDAADASVCDALDGGNSAASSAASIMTADASTRAPSAH